MTEQKKSTDAVETTLPQKPEKAPRKSRSYGWVGSTLSIAITLAIGAGGICLFYHGKQQNAALAAENLTLQQQVAALVQQQSADKQDADDKIEAIKNALEQANTQRQQLDNRMAELQDRISAMTNSDIENWRLAQANFLVKMASRKIWSDQDIATAIALLKDADSSLTEMNDPSLLYARSTIMQDIDMLSKINQVDIDGIILTLNQLSNQVDNLPLVDSVEQGKPMDGDDKGISASLSDWRENLSKSWHSFMDNFITIKPRDGSKEPLLAPKQEIYLRENIRSKLLIAAQAAPRRQIDTYKESLKSVSTWVRAYFDTSMPDTATFLNEVDKLEKRPLSIDIPEQLSSQTVLADLMRKRIYNLPHQPLYQSQVQPEIQPQPQSEEGSNQTETPAKEG
ncbi:uroporphyrin-3 C-methyltransferase [Xenorhabdus cabanillasii]|uniref:Uroporphyrin-3 C-methyltransferase n=1 Tax=Xenorhabdus cabanillasii TaxID=351673 RepID=A0A3D9U927_9GAMM|nr:uroporphyrinogen-III C-methyltransferase [Xenorhabdus cabanillasii]REF25766.1 uroporphyrin-3 C-methyltransferase [Xenorhabdus cabanillasii]